MTASPVWNIKDAVGSLEALEANMDAKVVGVRAHVDELAEHSPKPIEVSGRRCDHLSDYNLWLDHQGVPTSSRRV